MASPSKKRGTRAAHGKIILENFKTHYFDMNNKDYDVNYGMIVMAEKLSDFYTLTEINEIMAYYFLYHEGNFYEFVDKINKFKKQMREDKLQHEAFIELEQDTNNQLKIIKQSKVDDA